jgi:hypothetical protein
MPSLVKTLARWYWTVRALMNSRALIEVAQHRRAQLMHPGER